VSRRQNGQEERRQSPPHEAAHDPLRLCVLTTVALLTWLLGPAVVAALAALGFVGYLKARRAGLTSSRCILRDTRLLLGYLGLVGVVAIGAVLWPIRDLLS